MGKADDFSVFIDQAAVDPFRRCPAFLEIGGKPIERIIFAQGFDRERSALEASAKKVRSDPTVEQCMVVAVLI